MIRVLRPIAAAAVTLAAVPAIAAPEWSAAAPMPGARTEVWAATDGDRIFVAGGFAAGDGPPTAPRAVHAYDPQADAWQHLTDLPEGVNYAPLVHHDGRLYLVGGYRGTSFEPMDDLRIYDIAADRWQDGPPLPTPRGALAAVVLDGRIHAIGGVAPGEVNTGAHEIFSPETGEWSVAAEMPTPRDHHAPAVVDGEIVVLAGRNPETELLTVNEIYSADSDSWRSGAEVPTGRSGVAAVAYAGEAYLFGGEQFEPPATFDEAERYDVAADRWEALPPMPTPRHGLGAAVVGGAIHVIAGGPERGLSYSGVNEVLQPDRD